MGVDARTWGGGTRASRLLEPANILTTGIGLPLPEVPGDLNGLRLGSQELVRWGMGPEEMSCVAELTASVLLHGHDPAAVREDVLALRRPFQRLQFALDGVPGDA